MQKCLSFPLLPSLSLSLSLFVCPAFSETQQQIMIMCTKRHPRLGPRRGRKTQPRCLHRAERNGKDFVCEAAVEAF